MKFIATKKAFYNDSILNVGDSFDAEDGFSALWAVKEKAYKPDELPSDEKLAADAKEGLQGAKNVPKKKAKKKTSKKE